jgi:hypothetical protein
LFVLGLAGGCGDFASADLGLDDLMRIDGAQYRPGPFPASTGGPASATLQLGRPVAVRGGTRELLFGQIDIAAHAAIIGLYGTDGAWIVPAGSPDTFDPEEVTISTGYALTDDVPLGPFAVQLAAVDADGRIGDPVAADGVALDLPPPAGTLVVSLDWDGDADLDLHVVDPLGGEAYYGDPNTYMPMPGTFDPDAWMVGGTLDHDGNADCRRDGTPTEHVVWTMPPPPGDYTIRVDARDLCGEPSAAFSVAAYTNVTADDPGTLLGARRGVLVPDDVSQDDHGRGAGELALQFTLP